MAKKVPVKANVSFLSRYKFLLLGVFAAVLYFNTIPNSYNLDDELVTTTDPAYPHRLTSKGFEGLTAIFTEPYYKDDQGYAYDYRPVTMLTFWLENNLFSATPGMGHFISAVLYGCLCALLGFILANLLSAYTPVLWVSITLLFAAHPIHTEVVASIKNRDELLSVIFSLAALHMLSKVKSKQNYVPFLLAIILSALALLSKTTIIYFSLLTPLILIMFSGVPPVFLLAYSFILPLLYIPLSTFNSVSDAAVFVLLFPVATSGVLVVYNYRLIWPNVQSLWRKTLSGGAEVRSTVFTVVDKRRAIAPLYEILLLAATLVVSLTCSWLLYGYGKIYYLLPLILLFLPRLVFKLKYELPNAVAVLAAITGMAFSYPAKDVFVNLGIVYALVLMLSNQHLVFKVLPALFIAALAVLFDMDTVLGVGFWIAFFVYLQHLTRNYVPEKITGITEKLLAAATGIIVTIGALHFLANATTLASNQISYLYTFTMLPLTLVYIRRISYVAYPAFVVVLVLSLAILQPVKHAKTMEVNTGVVLNQPVPRVIPASEIDRPVVIVESVTNVNTPLEFKLGTAAQIIRKYISLIVVPYPLSFYYGYKIIDKESVYTALNMLTLFLYLGFGIAAVFLMRRQKLISLGLLIILVSLATFSNIIVPIPGMVAERFLLVPSLGFCVLLSFALIKAFKIDIDNTKTSFEWSNLPSPFRTTLVVILVLYAGFTMGRNFKWENHLTLYAADIGHLQESAQANNLYALQLMKYSFKEPDVIKQKQMRELAQQHFAAAVKIYPEFSNAQYDLARTQAMLGKMQEAEANFYKAAKLNPEYPPIWMSAAEMAMNDNRLPVAKAYLSEGLAFNKENPDFYLRLSLIYYKMGDYDSANVINKQALGLFPADPNFAANIGQTFAAAGKKDSALYYYNKSLSIKPDNDFVIRAIQNLKQ